MDKKYKTWKYWQEEWVKPLIIALILATLIRWFIVQPFKIPSTSMYPTLKIGDRIFVSKFLYGQRIPFTDKTTPKVRDPKRGDIIVFISTTDSAYPEPEEEYKRMLGPVFVNKTKFSLKWYAPRYIVKRLIGLPNENVEIKNGNVYINGILLDSPPIIKNMNYFNAGDYGQEGQLIQVPANSYFVLGDNSANSVDSRFWGFVPKKNIMGKVFIIWWPLTRIKIIK